MPDRYALFGHPLAHTKSPMIHGAFARDTGQDLSYEAIEAPVGGFAAAVDAFRARGGRGINVTQPFKVDAFEYATELCARAKAAGAVNCMKFEGARAIAENFDGVGLVNDIERNLGFALAGKRVLMMGAGGAARGAVLPLLSGGPALFAIANRTIAKAKSLGRHFAGHARLVTGGYGDFGDEPFDVVINATSASLRGELPPLDPRVFAVGGLAYDMVYGKGMTPFLRLAWNAGAGRLADGVGMLAEQAAEAFEWWRGVRPPTAPMIRKLAVPLA